MGIPPPGGGAAPGGTREPLTPETAWEEGRNDGAGEMHCQKGFLAQLEVKKINIQTKYVSMHRAISLVKMTPTQSHSPLHYIVEPPIKKRTSLQRAFSPQDMLNNTFLTSKERTPSLLQTMCPSFRGCIV